MSTLIPDFEYNELRLVLELPILISIYSLKSMQTLPHSIYTLLTRCTYTYHILLYTRQLDLALFFLIWKVWIWQNNDDNIRKILTEWLQHNKKCLTQHNVWQKITLYVDGLFLFYLNLLLDKFWSSCMHTNTSIQVKHDETWRILEIYIKP